MLINTNKTHQGNNYKQQENNAKTSEETQDLDINEHYIDQRKKTLKP
jgi:hypothetical protein